MASATPSPDRLEYDVVDVFADAPFEGNQLAVVHGTDGLTTEQLQSIAREFGFSETTFPTGASGATYDVRIFTPGQELPFAGHPTLGTAWVLREREAVIGDAVVQRCGAGDVPVRFVDGAVELTATPDLCDGPLPSDATDRLLRSVGLGAGDGAGDAWITGTGLPWAHLPVTVDALGRVTPPSAAVAELVGSERAGSAAVGVALVAIESTDGPVVRVRSRVFSRDADVGEDPATGSAAAALGVALVARGVLADGGRAEIVQGVEMLRPSRLHVSVDAADGAATAVRVAGQVHHVMSGTIAIPV
ncbi:MAG: PhzF family phenazine biosynthesis protein [Actinobacteria bacterium]|nr:PhzF family phenazine biosynthesis protein [Actinomycetota bacterium]